ncbi:hypothetical protein SCALIN_C18_0013 [Candidatus Scalindua japonica]|uniref:Uncharacterized protein n=1 Tax=Candidatus Scalindua japonica TaxID=1284222 RepID=A0A286TZ94_9BACT|nr:DUF6516 family protein [Candidatus Scalindua japonica]GAX61194.1 hypothetical protein SCALIN_C18_0013 [Candidatus Scalindua japonica]
MNNPLRTPKDYELFLYTIADSVQSVKHSSITFVRVGASLARVEGEIQFEDQVRLVVRERIIFDRLPAIIDWYGYEVWKRNEKLYWYDSQPHPNDYKLKISHPHHKHIPPNIKHNRIPAPEMSFTRPNLPVLIKEIEELDK